MAHNRDYKPEDIAFPEQSFGAVRAVEIPDRFHPDRGQHAHFLIERLKGRSKCEGVDDGSKHTHLVTLDAVETFLCATKSAEDIASSDNNGYLKALLAQRGNLLSIVIEALGIYPVALMPHKGLT